MTKNKPVWVLYYAREGCSFPTVKTVSYNIGGQANGR